MERKLIEKIHRIQMEMLKVSDKELNKIAIEVLEIEKKLINYEISKKSD